MERENDPFDQFKEILPFLVPPPPPSEFVTNIKKLSKCV